MKSLILVAVILQLVIIGIETDGKYNFGVIIEFPRRCGIYGHYAIYVGRGPNSVWRDVGQGDNDIFHRTGKIGKTDCTFGILANEKRGSQDVKKNYLDHVNKLNANRTPDKIAKRIRERDGNCGNYGPITNNCEHLATYVRYGVSRSLQGGRLAQCILKPIDLGQQVASYIQAIWTNSDENPEANC